MKSETKRRIYLWLMFLFCIFMAVGVLMGFIGETVGVLGAATLLVADGIYVFNYY